MQSQGITIFNEKLYGGKFQDAMNSLYSPTKINQTAALVKQLEAQHHKQFQVGIFNRYLLQPTDLPASSTFDQFEKDFSNIPENLRQQASDVLRANFYSASPMPVYSKVSENVDQTHDLIIKNFVLKGITYIGILYLCPNTSSYPP